MGHIRPIFYDPGAFIFYGEAMNAILKSSLLWLHGLAAGFIGAAAGSITVTVIDPAAFNFTTQWRKTLAVAIVGGIFQAAGYLAKSPLPTIPDKEKQ